MYVYAQGPCVTYLRVCTQTSGSGRQQLAPVHVHDQAVPCLPFKLYSLYNKEQHRYATAWLYIIA